MTDLSQSSKPSYAKMLEMAASWSCMSKAPEDSWPHSLFLPGVQPGPWWGSTSCCRSHCGPCRPWSQRRPRQENIWIKPQYAYFAPRFSVYLYVCKKLLCLRHFLWLSTSVTLLLSRAHLLMLSEGREREVLLSCSGFSCWCCMQCTRIKVSQASPKWLSKYCKRKPELEWVELFQIALWHHGFKYCASCSAGDLNRQSATSAGKWYRSQKQKKESLPVDMTMQTIIYNGKKGGRPIPGQMNREILCLCAKNGHKDNRKVFAVSQHNKPCT